MAFCKQCGAPLPEGRQFCSYCSAPIAAPTAAAPAPGPQQPPQYPAYPEPPRRTSQRIGQAPQFGEQPPQYGGQYVTMQQENPSFDWTRLQPRTRTGGATALIAGVTLLILAAVMLIWGMSI